VCVRAHACVGLANSYELISNKLIWKLGVKEEGVRGRRKEKKERKVLFSTPGLLCGQKASQLLKVIGGAITTLPSIEDAAAGWWHTR